MVKYTVLLALLLFTPPSDWAFFLDSADIQLLCPQRGRIEVAPHRYGHIQQSWGQCHFETGGGRACQGPLLVIPFANLNQTTHHQTTDEFAYWHAKTEKLVRCRLLGLTTLCPVNIPYLREQRYPARRSRVVQAWWLQLICDNVTGSDIPS